MKKIKICEFSSDDLLLDCIKKMTEYAKINSAYSLGVVLKNGKLLGSISDGDIRRYLVTPSADITSDLVQDVMHKEPFFVEENNINSIKDSLSDLNREIKYAFVTDSQKNYLYSIDLDDFFKKNGFIEISNISLREFDKTVVIGLGFVGLTLAVHIAKSGYPVIGVDSNTEVVNDLNNKKVPFYEQGLESALNELDVHSLLFNHDIPVLNKSKRNIFVVAVGTPIKNGKADFDQLESSIRLVNKHINNNDLLVIRSTVPIGTCKDFIPNFIDNDKQIYICMAPERTAEGVALSELQTLPQIIGADDKKSFEIAEKYFAKFSSSTVNVGSTSAAEICKLACNGYRDLNFGFSNELSLLCEELDIDAFELISNCNIGYSRMNMPLPSPGVGGYCLTKDPILYANSGTKISSLFQGKLSNFARKSNIQAGMTPDRALINFINKANPDKQKTCKILVCGVAFKGSPETDDIRFSTSMEFVDRMVSNNHDIYVTDATEMILKKLSSKFKIFNFFDKVDEDFDAIFVLNNNPKNLELNYSDWLNNPKSKLFFDGWHQFSSYKNNFKLNNTSYTTMGIIK